MTLNDFLSSIVGISSLLFVVTSMLALSFKLSVQQMTQPLKDIRLVILALVANFVLVPLLALAIIKIFPLDQTLQIGVILLGAAAGSPFIPKLVQGAKGNIPASVGLMFLIMVVSIFYIPIFLPLLLPGVEINPWDIAKSLIVTMLIPLIIGILIKLHSPDVADHWEPVMTKISSVSILIVWGGRVTLHSQAGTGRQGECPLLGWVDVPDHGCLHLLHTCFSAAAFAWG